MKKSLVYIGRRVLDEKIYHQFQYDNDQRAIFSGLKWIVIGRSYFGTLNDDKLTIKSTPDEDQDAPQAAEEDVTAWQVEDALAGDFIRRKTYAAKMARETILADIARRIAPLVDSLSFSKTRMLVEHLIDLAEKLNRERNRK